MGLVKCPARAACCCFVPRHDIFQLMWERLLLERDFHFSKQNTHKCFYTETALAC